MSDCSFYVADELIDHWPFLPKLWRDAKFAGFPRDYMDNFFLAMGAKEQSSLALAWKASPGRIFGSWRPRTTPE